MEFQPGRRLNVITGDNGLGKSFLLDLAWWAVTRTWSTSIPIRPPLEAKGRSAVDIAFAAKTKTARLQVIYDRPDQIWRFPKGQPGQPGLVVYARVDGDFAVWDSNRRFGDREELESGIPKALIFTREQAWNGLMLEGKPICNGLLADWTSWQQTSSWEASALAETLERLSPSDDQPVRPGQPARVDLLDSRLIPTLHMPYGQDVPITQASAGMKRVLALAYLLVWAWREHLEVSRFAGRPAAERMLVIIDEVEAHLHPKWQRVILSSIVDALNTLTTQFGHPGVSHRPPSVQYIIATHSPLVLASLEPIFSEPDDALFELHLAGPSPDKQGVVLTHTEFRRRGEADKWLLSDAFGLSSSRSVPAEQVISDAAALFGPGRHPSGRELREMEKRLSAVLPDVDPFWTRWRAVSERLQ
jgi:hypothetical protein